MREMCRTVGTFGQVPRIGTPQTPMQFIATSDVLMLAFGK